MGTGTGTELARRPWQNATLEPYLKLFRAGSKLEAIGWATGRLMTMLGRETEPLVIQGWQEQLYRYEPEQLADAFNRIERTVRAFPSIADMISAVERPQFHQELARLIAGLRVHGAEWRNVEERRDVGKWDYSGPDRVWVEGAVIQKAQVAPAISPRMTSTLCLFGAGTSGDGLKRLKRDHPAFWLESESYDTGQHSRQAAFIERDLYAAWMEVG